MIKEAINNRFPLLLIEDDPILSQTMKEFLESRGYRVVTTDLCSRAIDILNQNTFNVALVDKKLPDGEGTQILEYIMQKKLKTKTILITAYGRDRKIDEYIKKGAFDFMEKPFDLGKLLKRVDNANRMFQLEYSQDVINSYQIIGQSPGIKRIKEIIRHVARSDIPVLINGETGTGKELVARNIHLESNRNDKQFISVNCASIPENLFESEFFGYKKGAFTGAFIEKPGFFEMAHEGILHLDEIGEMPMGFQAKLLRVLEQGSFIKLGGIKEIYVNVRIIASTNKILKDEVESRRFRKDLYFRLAVFTIDIPPLRERKEDIAFIARYIWQNINLKMGQSVKPVPFSWEKLKHQPWKGNVRELRNYLEKELIYLNMGGDSVLRNISQKPTEEINKEIILLEEHTKKYVIEVLNHFNYNKTQTARALGISLSTLKRKLIAWDIQIQKKIGNQDN